MKIGYARISTAEQVIDLQVDSLTKQGCHRVYEDVASGAKVQRPELEKCLHALREGDTLAVWRLDRLGRSLKHLVELINALTEKNIHFVSLHENIDTSSAAGKLTFHIFASLAEFERSLISERTIAGLKAARARGKFGGRPKKLSTGDIVQIKALHANRDIPIADILKRFSITKTTLYKYLKDN